MTAFSRLTRAALLGGLPAFAAAAPAPTAPAPLAALTYSGDQAPLEQLDRDLQAAGRDPARLAALEERLAGLLRRPDVTFASRQALCARLALVLAGQPAAPLRPATARILRTMLAEERDADLARQVLEGCPSPDADAMLLSALEKAAGTARLGLIDTLGRRGAPAAVPALAGLLAAPDAATQSASAHALGRIGSPAAAAALRAATAAPPAVIGAAQLAAVGRLPDPAALGLLRELEADTRMPAILRVAAFRSRLDREGPAGHAHLVAALEGADPDRRDAAIEALGGRPEADRVRAAAGALPGLPAPAAAGVVAALGRSGQAAAVPAVLAMVGHADAFIRLEALSALGLLPGDAAVTGALLEASLGEGETARTARQSLTRLGGAAVGPAILAGAESGPAARRIACLDQLALRRQSEGLGLLRRLREDPDATVRGAAAAALGELAPPADLPLLIGWASQGADEAERGRALRAVVTLIQRHRPDSAPAEVFFRSLDQAAPAAALRLLPALGRLATEASAACAARLAAGADVPLAAAAVEALDRWPDGSALGGLVAAAEQARTPELRTAARAAALRQAGRDRSAWTKARTDSVVRLHATGSAEERARGLRLLARAADETALRHAEDLRADAALGAEAGYTAAVIRANLAGRPRARASQPSGINNVFDGKTSTRWGTPLAGEEWLELDFRVSRPFRTITLDQTARAAEFPERYEVHVTDDPSRPGPAVLAGAGQRNRTVLELPAGTTGRYVVIRNVAARAETPWTIAEIHVD